VPEIELYAGLQAPFEGNLVDGDRALAAVHGGGEMPGRIEVGGAVGGELDPLDRPTFAVWQVVLGKAGKELDHVGRRLPMCEIVDLGPMAGRIGGDVVLQRHRDVDQLTRHVIAPPVG
jgi:hypothetical protein